MVKQTKPTKPPSPPTGIAKRSLGALLMAIALTACGILSYTYIAGREIPGCGPGSACDDAMRSVWGSVPGLNWPVAHLGSAYFLGLLFAWIFSPTISAGLRNLVRVGGLVSLLFAVVIVVTRLSCPYCITAHAANFLFWILIETIRPAGSTSNHAVAIALAGFVSGSLGLGLADWNARERAVRDAQKNARESTAAIIAATSQRTAAPEDAATRPAIAAQGSQPSASQTTAAPAEQTSKGQSFTGRYRKGPEKAAIRIVACSDFQCPACKQVDGELEAIFKSRKDVAISMKHFPMCLECNKHAGRTMHANACWAARAAEAAGILKGDAGFWGMHDALFAASGNFITAQQLRDMVTPLGFEFTEFERTMKSSEALSRVQADIEDCMSIGMRYTPMVLINGVEFRGWERLGAIREAVEAVAATNPPALAWEADVLPPAGERLARLWLGEPAIAMASDIYRHSTGPEGAKVRVVLFGDYQEPSVAVADGYLRERAAAGEIRYSFAHFPSGKECNTTVPKTIHANACWAARTAEAAAQLGGEGAFWSAHAWMMSHQGELNDAAIAGALADWALNADDVKQVTSGSEVSKAIQSHIAAGKAAKIASVPWIIVNDRVVPVWQYQGENLLPLIIRLAK